MSWSVEGFVSGDYGGGVTSLCALADGTIAIGGDFTSAGSLDTAFLAFWQPTCPASADLLPASCNGSLGPLSLTAQALPWLGGTFASTASGFAPNALGASLLGFTSPNTLLASVTPFAAPGCLQLASTEGLALALPQSGAAAYTFSIPNTPAYVGMTLFHQFLQLEPGSASQSPLLSSSNGLRLVFGTY